MKILALDTSSVVASVAITVDGQLRVEEFVHNGLTHSETLLPMIDIVFKNAKLTSADIDYFAVNIGPGSFTGLRIGIATVKGLAHATNKTVIPICTLDSLAYPLRNQNTLISPIMDARRAQVYTAIYQSDLKYRLQPTAISIDELIDKFTEDDKVIFVGDGVSVHKDYIKQKLPNATFADEFINYQRASVIAAMAQERTDQSIPPYNVVPIYLRKSQAERELEEKQDNKIEKNILF